MKMEVEKLSPSRINTYLTCGMRYYFRYVEGLIVPPGSALTLGASVHSTVAANMRQKLESHEDLPESDLCEHFAAVFDLEHTHTAWYADEDPGEIKDVGIRLVKTHRQLVSPDLQPIAVEKGFVTTLGVSERMRKRAEERGDVPRETYPPIEGWVDTINQDAVTIETKTTGKKPSHVAANHKLQTVIYTAGILSAGVQTPGARVDYLVKTKKQQVVSFPIVPVKSDFMFMEDVLDRVCRCVELDIYLPNREFYGCTRRNCGYWEHCEKEIHGRVRD
jgi:CRISPR/Cas system-associated exonuclease Cas4 (RecB family)